MKNLLHFAFPLLVSISRLHAGDAPPNSPAEVEWAPDTGVLRLSYHGGVILDAKIEGGPAALTKVEDSSPGLSQHLTFTGKNLHLNARAHGSDQLIAAETRTKAQEKFSLVRTTHGSSDNLRNNALYDRKADRQLEFLALSVRLIPAGETASGHDFTLSAAGDAIEIVFRPRFYQRHKGIEFFEPWTYDVRQDSITGWSSWWAFRRACTQQDCDSLLAVWQEKHLDDYGYRFIQLDDCYQNELGKGQARPIYPGSDKSYNARGPETWLDWRKDTYPAGLAGYVAACKKAGFHPGVWIGAYFTDNEVITTHPDWFVRDASGKPATGPWISCGVDATNEAALNALVRPTFSGVRKAGVDYVKIDLLRHYFYDLLNRHPDYCREHGVTSAEMFRKLLGAARHELGPDTFVLSCWGVLPESVGLADACRIASDGYGPVSMQQYNSWNGIVWRNDPDHCDVFPQFKAGETGNVTKFDHVVPTNNDTVIRPALASIAGTLLMLSDKPEVYRDDRNIEGAKRSSPVLSSVPGQLYDFDGSKSAALATVPRTSIQSGSNPAPGDANQFGAVCPWWLNEFDLPGVGHWNVLHRVNWGKAAPAVTLDFADLGLEPDADYLAYEFWTHTYLGIHRGHLDLPAAADHELRSYALRKLEPHPQIVSTSRHLSQGAADLISVVWKDDTLSGSSHVIVGDRYELVLHVPTGYHVKSATIAGQAVTPTADPDAKGELVRLAITPATTGKVEWSISFSR